MCLFRLLYVCWLFSEVAAVSLFFLFFCFFNFVVVCFLFVFVCLFFVAFFFL